ncbi:MAG: amino acid permease [Acidobacteriaceae bacterium]|nr:amino acid permease [Acidobacteriaceae bacterium]MBV9780072.1 amino acid permease [Acidobacteriaceae bacterium]
MPVPYDEHLNGGPLTRVASPYRVSGPSLQRVLGLWSAVSIVVGTVIGSGVFLVPSTMIRYVGSPRNLFIVWIVAGLLSLFGALTYAELAAALPEAGGEYVYLSEAYGPFWGFLYGWTQFWVAKSGSIATLAAGFYTYLTLFVPVLGATLWTVPLHIGPGGSLLEIHYGQLVAIALILSLAGVNYIGVRSGGNIQVLVTAIKMLLIAGIVFVGLFSGRGESSHFTGHISSLGGVAGFFAAMVSALWAYDGWNNVSMVSSEICEPQRNLPRALIFGTAAVILTYISINLAYFYVLTPEQVAASHRVAADMIASLYGPLATHAVAIAVMISIFAALNGSILSGGRIPYAMARDRLFFRYAADVHPKFRTPGHAMILLCLWSCVVVLSGWYDDLYNFVIFGSWILYLMTAVSVFVLRKKRPDLPRPYRVIGYPIVPVLFIGVAMLLLISTVQTRPRESLMGLILMGLAVPFYAFWRNSRRSRR